jgi:hypothetical protein
MTFSQEDSLSPLVQISLFRSDDTSIFS